jgi:hypothetical protein
MQKLPGRVGADPLGAAGAAGSRIDDRLGRNFRFDRLHDHGRRRRIDVRFLPAEAEPAAVRLNPGDNCIKLFFYVAS